MKIAVSFVAVLFSLSHVSAQWLTLENNIYFTKGFVGVGGAPGYRFHIKLADQSNAAVIESPDATFNFSRSTMEMREKTGSVNKPSIVWYSSAGNRLSALGTRMSGGGLALTLDRPNNFFISGGNVGIGVDDTRGYMLAVGGKFVAEEVVVKLKGFWPDYVFHDDYTLMPLDELSTFIDKHRRLPDVPSAATISEGGIILGDITPILLKKIEELTLYIIRERESNKTLQKRLEELEGQLMLNEENGR